MLLKDLCEQLANDPDCVLQVNYEEYGDWDVFDTVMADSPIIEPFKECRIKNLTAIGKDTFRFELMMED